MDCATAVQELLDDTARVVGCRPTGRHGSILLTTTAMYSDRDLVQLVVEDLGERIRVSDGGLTFMRLDMHGAPFHTDAHQDRVKRITASYGVQLDQEVLEIIVPAEHLADAVGSVASAAVQVDTIIHEAPRSRTSFADKVEDWLGDRTDKTVTKTQLPGHTYPVLRVDTRHPVFVAPVTGGANRHTAIQVAGWRMEAAMNLTIGQRVILLNAELDKYPPEEIDRIIEFATIGIWSHRTRLLNHLRDADQEIWQPHERLLVSQQSL